MIRVTKFELKEKLMTQDFEIVYADEMDKEYLKKTLGILDEHAKEARGFKTTESFSFTITDKNKNFIAGITGVIFLLQCM